MVCGWTEWRKTAEAVEGEDTAERIAIARTGS